MVYWQVSLRRWFLPRLPIPAKFGGCHLFLFTANLFTAKFAARFRRVSISVRVPGISPGISLLANQFNGCHLSMDSFNTRNPSCKTPHVVTQKTQ